LTEAKPLNSRIMASLEGLLNELKDIVFANLTIRDLLNAAAIRCTYRHLTLLWKYANKDQKSRNRGFSFEILNRSLHSRVGLRQSAKSLNLSTSVAMDVCDRKLNLRDKEEFYLNMQRVLSHFSQLDSLEVAIDLCVAI
jgi:hypothetical protein